MFSLITEKKPSDPSERLKAAFKHRAQLGVKFDDYFVPDFEVRNRRQKWSDKTIRAAAALDATTLRKTNQYATELQKAFDAAGLDPKNPYSWRTLLEFFALAHFEDPSKRGAPIKWTSQQLCLLLVDFSAAKRRHPGKSDSWLCDQLVKTPDYKAYARGKKISGAAGSSLRRFLQDARNEAKNAALRKHYDRHLAALRKSSPEIGDPNARAKARKLAAEDVVNDWNTDSDDFDQLLGLSF